MADAALRSRLDERREVLRTRSALLAAAVEDGADDLDAQVMILLDEVEALRDLYRVILLDGIRRRMREPESPWCLG